MNKTISVLLCKRPDYSRQTLEYLGKAQNIEDWKVNVYCDVPGHQSDIALKWAVNADKTLADKLNVRAVYDVAKSFDFVEEVRVAPRPLGLKAATLWALRENFISKKSDFNLHIEDDVLVSIGALDFVEACHPYIRGKIGSVSLQGDCGEGAELPKDFQEAKPEQVFPWNHFTCGWGWATTREFYLKEFIKAPDQGVPASWAVNLAQLYKDKNFCELRSNARRSKNIGANLSTHLKEAHPRALGQLNCVDVGDDWLGNKQQVVDCDFSLLEQDKT